MRPSSDAEVVVRAGNPVSAAAVSDAFAAFCVVVGLSVVLVVSGVFAAGSVVGFGGAAFAVVVVGDLPSAVVSVKAGSLGF